MGARHRPGAQSIPPSLRSWAPAVHVNSGSALLGAPCASSEPPGTGSRQRCAPAPQGLSPPEPFALLIRAPAPPAGCCTGHPPARTSEPPPAPASRKLPVLSTAFLGRESCRFAASPKVGVYAAERYKYERLTVLCTRRRQEERADTADR